MDKIQKSIKPYLYLVPVMSFFLIFVAIPIFYTIYLSFFDWNMIKPTKEFVGLGNYTALIMSKDFWKIFGNTIWYIILLIGINFIVPFIFAFICKFMFHKFQNFYKVTLFLPGFISLVVGSMIFTWILNPVVGPIAMWLKTIGITMPIWSTTEGLVIVVISLITSWKSFGYNFIMLFAAVGGVSTEVVEAAKLDDIPLHKIFTKVVAPMTGSTAFYVLVMTITQGLTYVFSPIEVLTGGGPNYGSSNLIYDSYFQAFKLFETGTSAAISVISLCIFGVGLYALNEFVGKKVYYEN